MLVSARPREFTRGCSRKTIAPLHVDQKITRIGSIANVTYLPVLVVDKFFIFV